jgi:broad specificity phosphatase PhoE
MRIGKLGFAASRLLFAAAIALIAVGYQQARAAAPATTMPADDASPTGTETIVFLRHGEKPKGGLGQLTPQGLNRALALSTLLPAKYGKPDFLFAPDPAGKSDSDPKKKSPGYNYIRPLMTIEPTAIALGMPVQTPFTFPQIDKLDQELDKPEYATSLIFVAWEHAVEAKAAKNLVQQFGGDPAQVPAWDGKDFDSLYVVKIIRVAGRPTTVTFTHDHEGLDHQSQEMPIPVAAADH